MKLYADFDVNLRDPNTAQVTGSIVIHTHKTENQVTLSWHDYDGGSEDFEEVYDDLPTALLRAALLVACAEGRHGTAFNQSETLFTEVARDFIADAIS